MPNPLQQEQHSQVIDPDNVPETLCDGRFYIHPHGNLATLTFTHARLRAADLFGGRVNAEEVIRARITLTMDNLVALRDLLNNLVKVGPDQMPSSGASSRKLN
jgi:hypothetical protein